MFEPGRALWPTGSASLPFTPDFCAWSYAAQAVKPQPGIYRYLCDGLACRPEEIIMVGDTYEADRIGPREFGIHGYHLDRRDGANNPDSLRSLHDVLALIESH